MPSTIPCAYLRTYQPLETFPPEERERLTQSLTRPPKRVPRDRFALGLLEEAELRDVFAKKSGETIYVCPAQQHLRRLLSLVAFERSLPRGTSEVFFSPSDVNDARRELERMNAGGPDVRPFIVQSPWHVPIRWFACFDDSERRLEQTEDHPRVRYETSLAKARRRIGAAIDVLKQATVHPVIVGMVYEVNEWLKTFDERSILELDYASVSRLFEPDELADDHSAADVWAAIDALGAGDGVKAALYYQRVNERWAPHRTLHSLN